MILKYGPDAVTAFRNFGQVSGLCCQTFRRGTITPTRTPVAGNTVFLEQEPTNILSLKR
jgi:hypothetical protein